MKRKMLTRVALLCTWLSTVPTAVYAAPDVHNVISTAVQFAEAEPVNPPGWVGGLLTIIALLLVGIFSFWARQK